ncbi:MAG: NO-inducible flavohemoprotein [Bermanella sp.]
MITQQQRQLIDATLPTVEANAVKITSCFYPLMFKRYPEVLVYFNQTNQAKGTQRLALANAVVAYAKHLDKLGEISDTVRLITQKHCSLGILPEHYPIVGECLLAAIGEVLADVITDEIIDAWGAAYQQLADILIGVEQNVYQENSQRSGGWKGEKNFELIKKTQESDVITSFLLQPKDQNEVIDFTPGQYITLVHSLNGETVRRNYSLSAAPGKNTLQISVKREEGGVLSNYLHDELQIGEELTLTAPCGDFTLKSNVKPLVLVTAGVGITPALSMLNAAVDEHLVKGREIHFIHCARNGDSHAFAGEVKRITENNKGISNTFIYSHPSTTDLNGESGHADDFGFLTAQHFTKHLKQDSDVECYVLGPKPFMQTALQLAADFGIPQGQTHFEFFGPKEELSIERNKEEVAA